MGWGWCTKDEELHATVVAQRPLDPHLSTLNKSPTTMFRKLLVPVFLLLAFAAHSALGVTTSMSAPSTIHPGVPFRVTFHNKPRSEDEWCCVFGLFPGTKPPPDDDLGQFVFTGPGCETPHLNMPPPPTFKCTLTLPSPLPNTLPPGPKHKFVLTAACLVTVSWVPVAAATMNPLIWLGFTHSILFCMCRLVR